MKTIFLSSFHGYTSRNILDTDFFRIITLRDDIRIIIFVPKGKAEYFRKNYARSSVIIEEVFFGATSSASILSLLMKRTFKFGLNTVSTRIERLMKWKNDGKFFYFLFASFLAFSMSRSRFLRRSARKLDYFLAKKNRYEGYFDKYKPDLVLVTDIQNERDVELMHNAKNFGVRYFGIVRSWDNLTLHGIIRIIPDILFVPSPKVGEQAVKFHDVDSKKIEITGVIHYDKYFRGPKIPKKDFFEPMNFDVNKKTILWAPISDYYLPNNDIDIYIYNLFGKLNSQVIARFSPSLEVKALDNKTPYPNMFFDRPGLKLSGGDKVLSAEDDDRLMHSIYYCDVIVTGPTTVALDAIFIDKPVILVAFHPHVQDYLKTVLRRYAYDHFKIAIDTGGLRVAGSEDELKKLIKEYLQDSAKDAQGRGKLREIFTGPRDGKSGERMAKIIINSLPL